MHKISILLAIPTETPTNEANVEFETLPEMRNNNKKILKVLVGALCYSVIISICFISSKR